MTKLLLQFSLSESFDDAAFVAFGALKAIAIAAFAWWFCAFSMHLWNRRFKLRLVHHALCAVSAITTLLALFLFQCVGEIKTFALEVTKGWQEEYRLDSTFRHETFVQVYHALQALYQQNGWEWDYQKFPEPVANPSQDEQTNTFSIPWSSSRPEAAAVSVRILCDRAVEHFTTSQPILGQILWGGSKVDPEPLRRDIEGYFVTHPDEPYPFESGPARVAGSLAVQKLNQEIGRQIAKLQWELIGLCLMAQLMVFSIAAYSAWSDVKIHS